MYPHDIPDLSYQRSKIKEKVNGKEQRNNQLSFQIKNLEDKMQRKYDEL